MGDYTTESYADYFISHEIRIPSLKKPEFHSKSPAISFSRFAHVDSVDPWSVFHISERKEIPDLPTLFLSKKSFALESCTLPYPILHVIPSFWPIFLGRIKKVKECKNNWQFSVILPSKWVHCVWVLGWCHTVEGSEIPNNHRLDGAKNPCKTMEVNYLSLNWWVYRISEPPNSINDRFLFSQKKTTKTIPPFPPFQTFNTRRLGAPFKRSSDAAPIEQRMREIEELRDDEFVSGRGGREFHRKLHPLEL